MNRAVALARAVLVVLVVAAAATACSAGPKDSLVAENPPNGGMVGGSDTVPAHMPYVFPLENLCTTGGPVLVTKVIPAHPHGGLRIADWGIRLRYPGDPYPPGNVGAIRGLTTERLPGFSPRQKVTARCGDNKRFDQFNVSVERFGPRATMTGVWVYYGADGKRVFAQYDFALCASKPCVSPHQND